MYRRISQNMMCDAELLVDAGYRQLADDSSAYMFSGNAHANRGMQLQQRALERLPNITENTAVCSCPIQTRGGNGANEANDCIRTNTVPLWPYGDSNPIPFQRWSRTDRDAINQSDNINKCLAFSWTDSPTLDRSLCRT
jgi:hypothetical protein